MPPLYLWLGIHPLDNFDIYHTEDARHPDFLTRMAEIKQLMRRNKALNRLVEEHGICLGYSRVAVLRAPTQHFSESCGWFFARPTLPDGPYVSVQAWIDKMEKEEKYAALFILSNNRRRCKITSTRSLVIHPQGDASYWTAQAGTSSFRVFRPPTGYLEGRITLGKRR